MDFLGRVFLLSGLALWLSGCQLSYYIHSAYHQAKLATARQPIAKVLDSDKLTEEQKRKLRLVQEVKAFGEEKLGLARSSNYTTFVQLEEPYVTYIVQAAYAYELKPHLWHFPFVGSVPYKGYFRRALAEEEARSFDKNLYDTYVRGVSAYSTLGWFQDSVLSSMLRYEDIDLVETILHESIHTTLFIKNAAEFNERLATFMGHTGMILFYTEKEGPTSPHLQEALNDQRDQELFSKFLTKELDQLKTWYETNKNKVSAESKAERLKELKDHFMKDLKPQLKTKSYLEFEKRELNNALLLAYRTYEHSLEDFAKLYAHFDSDFGKTLDWLKDLSQDPEPEKTLKAFVQANP